MRYIIILFTPLFLFATSSFITPMEYATQLYKNPRGIGCQKCHGDSGDGELIAKYEHKGKKRAFSAPSINNISFKKFYKALNKRKNAMPRYFLTDSEIKALFLHLHKNDKKKNVR